MINPSDFAPLAASIAPLSPRPAASPVVGATPASPAGWFDAAAVSGDTRISADLNLGARGLSVEQHAERVLAHLRGDREGGA